MEPEPISSPRPILQRYRRLPTLESEDAEANVASASSNQPSWTPNMRRQWRENWRKSTPASYLQEVGVLFVLPTPHSFWSRLLTLRDRSDRRLQPPYGPLLPRNGRRREPRPPVVETPSSPPSAPVKKRSQHGLHRRNVDHDAHFLGGPFSRPLG